MRKLGLAAIGTSILIAACGRKGPLLYPDMLVATAPAAISVMQSGSGVKLQFMLPDKDMAGRQLHGISGIKISRKTVEASDKGQCQSCVTDYPLFQTLYLDHLPSYVHRSANRLILLDEDIRIGKSYSYRIVPFMADGTDGASATTTDVNISTSIFAPDLRVESLPTEVKLKITSQASPEMKLIGYNYYRAIVGEHAPLKPLNSEPVKAEEYVDSTLERGVTYYYTARKVVLLPSGNSVESAASEENKGMLWNDE